MDPLEKFLGQVNYIHGPGVAETSYYGALEAFLNTIGEGLTPRVLCVMQLRDTGAGVPDGGLFSTDQFPRGADVRDEAPTLLPGRGAIEVKSPGEDITTIAHGEQVTRYLRQYRQVLVTNLRAFVLMGLDSRGTPIELETYHLAEDEATFWRMAQHPRRAAVNHGERIAEYLKRIMLHAAPLATPEALADFLASYAREARARVQAAMAGGDFPAMTEIRTSLEETLGIHFSGERGDRFFRASLVQTLFYGIFAAFVLWHNDHPASDETFDWRVATYYLHVPLVQALFERIAVPSRLRRLDLMEVLDWTGQVLNRVDRAAFFARFEQERAVQYFYEPFLEAYDPELRKELGVWYTPPEVIDYMVARVDTVLREELGVADGLADPRVHVLDPCCGTGAYLVAVLKHIAATLRSRGVDALLAQDLKTAAMTRVHGFEILPAPFVISHLQLGLLLREWGVSLSEEERVSVYLTNALTGWEPQEEGAKAQLLSPAFRRERAAAERVKQDAPILVILGNPPYDSFAGMAVGEERALSQAYRTARDGPQPRGQGLNDLYIRFFRMAERRIVERTGQGIVCFISNYSWLDGLSHPGMRERYLDVFDKIWIDSLNGDKYRTGKTTPDGKPDPSIFSTSMNPEGIQVGTAISLLARTKPHTASAIVHFRDIWGKAKWQLLVDDAAGRGGSEEACAQITPAAALGHPFRPLEAGADFLDWPRLPELFPRFFPGVQTGRDAALVDIDRKAVVERMRLYFDSSLSDDDVAEAVPRLMKSTRRFNAPAIRSYLVRRGFLQDYIVQYMHRPFDLRWLYWEPETELLDRKRPDYYPHVLDSNIWLVSEQKARRGYSPPLFIRRLGGRHLMERGASIFPLNLKEQGLFAALEPEPKPNLTEAAQTYLTTIDAEPEDLFYHVLATLHAPSYGEENDGALRQDWPRVPVPTTAGTLHSSATLGRRVAALLDPEGPVEGVTVGRLRPELRAIAVISHVEDKHLDPAGGDLSVTAGWGYLGRNDITMPGQGRTLTIEGSDPPALDVCLNDIAYWHNVPEDVWDYTLGGYQVLKKWLSYREQRVLGRDLKTEEARAFTEIARRIAALLALQPELDDTYNDVKLEVFPWN